MAKKIMQYRYYNEESENNQPRTSAENISAVSLVNGSIFSKRIPITQLGIQTLPGTKFYLNNGSEPIIIGSTGIYELDLTTGAVITAIRFNSDSISTIQENDSAFLIVDIVYEEEV